MIAGRNISFSRLNELIKQCIDGNRFAQSQLYRLLAPQMFTVCLRYAKSREEAEEVLQEGFLKVFKFMHQYSSAGSFEGWVRKIMVNCALQQYRKKPVLYTVIDYESTPTEQGSNEDIISQISTKELIQVIQQLPSAYRMVFNLYVFEGLRHREIAALLGIAEGTSKSNLSDARAILQKAVQNNMEIIKKKVS